MRPITNSWVRPHIPLMGLMINEKQMWFENYDIDYVSLNKTQSSNKLIFGPPAKTILL